MPYVFEDSSVDTSYFTDNRAAGGEGGSHFDYVLYNGAILKKIRLWKRDWRIGAVEITMTDGSKRTFGKPTGGASEFTFRSGERITKIRVQASGPYSSKLNRRRLGAVWFQTNQNRSWGLFCNDLVDGVQHWPDVGSGICCGIFGAGGDDVDRLGFAFLWPIQRAVLSNVRYPNLSLEVVASQPETVATQVFKNNTDIEQSFILKGSRSVTITREWSISTTLSLSVTAEVSAGIPEVASVSGSTTWEVSATATYDVTTSNTETKSWEWPIVCPPHTQIFASATMYGDDIETEYEADMKLRLSNGKTYSYQEKGVYRGLNVRSGTVNIENV